jgi:hypothetical protein
MVKQRPRWIVFAAAGAVILLAAYSLMPADAPGPATPVRAGERSRPGPAESPLPVIDFARIANPPPAPGLGTRDLFDFAAPPPPPITLPGPRSASAQGGGPPPEDLPPITVPTPTPVPPLNIKYIGAVERRGVKVAMLMTERSEVLTGQVGETVGNRFRIVKIGLESVDIQEVGSDQVRRIPLKGN